MTPGTGEHFVKAEQFVKSVEGLAKLLSGLSIESVAEAIKVESCEKSVDVFNERRKAWAGLCIEMADDMGKLSARLLDAKMDSAQCLARISAAVRVFNGSEFKEATDRFDRFIGLCERFQSLKNSGFLDTVIETIAKA